MARFLLHINTRAVLLIALFLAFSAITAFTGDIIFLYLPILLLLALLGWQRMDLVFFLLIFFLPLSVEYNISETLSIDLPDEPLMIFLAFGMIGTWIYQPRVLSGEILSHPLITLLFLFISWTVASVFFSSEFILSGKYLLAKIWYILAFVFMPLIFFQQQSNIRKATLLFLFSLGAAVGIILVNHARLGFRFSEINDAVAPLFRNHVNYSAMLVCSIPVLIAGFSLTSPKKRLMWVIPIVIFLFALYFSYSRGAWLALVGGILTYWLIRKKLLVITFLVSVILGVFIFTWLRSNDNYLRFAHNYNKTIFHPDFKKHIRATYELEDISTAERFYRWVAGVRMIRDEPLTGFGPNSFYYHYKEYGLPAFKTWVSQNPEKSTVHNYFLLLAIEQGIPGLILFLILLGFLLFYAQRVFHRARDKFYRVVALATGVMMIMIIVLNFLSDLVETDKIGSLFFLCIAILIIADVKTRKI